MTNAQARNIINKWFTDDGVNLLNLVWMVVKHQARLAGSTKSEAKSRAARLNGMKGGRPRKEK